MQWFCTNYEQTLSVPGLGVKGQQGAKEGQSLTSTNCSLARLLVGYVVQYLLLGMFIHSIIR